jgi:hypothetical protein
MSGHDSRLSRFLRQTAIFILTHHCLSMFISKEMQPELRFLSHFWVLESAAF